jgi:hypothetical protein
MGEKVQGSTAKFAKIDSSVAKTRHHRDKKADVRGEAIKKARLGSRAFSDFYARTA